jgi:DNA-binding NtrC family response regulator
LRETDNQLKPVLLVDDEEHILNISKLFLQSCGITEVPTLSDSRKVLPFLATRPVSVIVLDLHMPHTSGLELLPRIIKDYPHIPVILMTANDDIETVVECMKMGAFDYLAKPVESRRLVASVTKALDMCDLSDELSSLKERLLSDNLEHPAAFASIVSGNKKMRALFQYAEVVAGTRQPIMITGETGAGKELLARAIHDISGCRGEFVALNVAGLDDNMFSDTLFGHKKGAFTGADQTREGLIARAGGGTLFLDEIGDLNETSQIKLLRLLQEKEYYPVGSDMVRKSDARILLATNRDLQKQIAAGKFRNDLYYRLCAHQVQIPPLRERLDDIPQLLNHFLELAATTLNRRKPATPPELLTLLSLYHFPGNVRELEAMVFDAMARHDSGILSMESFRRVIGDERPAALVAAREPLPGESPLAAMFGHFPTFDEIEDYMVDEAMKMAKGNQGIAANLLGIGRQTLNKRLKTKE